MKKKLIIGLSIVVVAGIITVTLLSGLMGGGGPGGSVSVRATTLSRGDLSVSVNVTGTVHSADLTNVYSTLSFPVSEVNVQVGDRVEYGDVLAQLDTANLQSDIAQRRAALSSAQANAQQSLAVAQNNLETAQHNIDSGLDNSLISAESAVTAAELAVQSARLEVQIARRNLTEARRSNWESDLYDDEDDFIRGLRDQHARTQHTLEIRNAELERAQLSLEAARAAQGQSITAHENQVTSAQLGQNFNDQWIAIQRMESDLERATITSPVYGTVTAVLTEEGASGAGLLFVVENTDDLVIYTSIREFDIGQVTEGDRVVIRSDGTGDREFAGTLTHIAPTTQRGQTGQPINTTDAEFRAEVSVDGGSGLRIGMNTRMDIITQEVANVFTVPFEAVSYNAQGQAVVFAAVQQEDGSLTAQMIQVSTGPENDFFIVIDSDELHEGMVIIADSDGIAEGDVVVIRGAGAGG